MRIHCSLLLVVLSLGLAACDALSDEAFEPRYVVESYQIAGEPLQPVLLSRTTTLATTYNFAELAVRDADVQIELLRDDGTVEMTYGYAGQPDSAGVYVAQDAQAVAQPLRTYRLRIRVPDREEVITATTVVPDTFRLVGATADTVVYQSAEQLEITSTRSLYPGRQNIFIFTTEALGALSVDRLPPFQRAVFDNADNPVLENFRVGSSPILNESNYRVHADGTITISLPWIAITFYGANRVSASAIDDNLYDFIRSSSVQQGGSTLAPGEIPNVLLNVEGAAGFFGSYARVGYNVYVERR